MTLDLNKIKKLQEEAAATARDLTKPQEGGGDYQPPAEGQTRVRLVGYVELGTHTSSFKGTPKTKPRCELTFELSGPKHEPRKLDDGTLIPHRITLRETVGYHKKSNYIKLFNVLNAGGTATTFLDLVGNAWLAQVTHRKFTRADGSEGTVAELKKNEAYTFRPTTYEDPESGELRSVKVSAPVGDLRVFLWDYPSLDTWNSLFIDGQFDDGASKNKLQIKIVQAENFPGSSVEEFLLTHKIDIDSLRKAGAKAPAEPEEAPDDEGEAEVPDTPAKAAKATGKASKGKPSAPDADPLAQGV